MDGSNRIALITESILRPNGLCVDYPAERIYWADAKHHVIESSKLDGSERRKVNKFYKAYLFYLYPRKILS